MSSKAIKATLKRVKEAIDSKDYQVGRQECQNVLKDDPSNYQALLFDGFCSDKLGSYGDSEKSYKRAIDSNSGRMEAWKGLTLVCERFKDGEHIAQLKACYEKLITLTSDQDKLDELREKLISNYLHSADPAHTDSVQTTHSEVKSAFINIESEEVKKRVDVLLAEFYSKFNTLFNAQFMEIMVNMSDWSCLTSSCIINYTNIKYQNESNLPVMLNVLSRVYEYMTVKRSDTDIKSVENLLAKIITNLYINFQTCEIEVPESLYKLSVEVISPDKLKIINNQDETTLNLLESLKAEFNSSASKLSLNLRLALSQKLYDVAEELANQLSDSAHLTAPCLQTFCIDKFRHVSVCGCIRVNYYKESYDVVCQIFRDNKDLLCDSLAVLDLYYESLIELENYTELPHDLELSSPAIYCYMKYKQGDIQTAQNRLESLISDSPTCQSLMWLGLILMNSDKTRASQNLLKAAKLDSTNYKPFYYLYQFYQTYRDHTRSMKCLRKSYELNKFSKTVCRGLSDLYTKNNQYEEAYTLLSSITSSGVVSVHNKWAWLSLGVLHLHQDELDKSIKCLQKVVRLSDDDTTAWQCLGDSYYKQGSYQSAVGAFQRSVGLNSNCVYSKFRLASINYKLNNLIQSKQEYTEILIINEKYVPALKGLADVYMKEAEIALNQTIIPQQAVKSINSAVKYLYLCIINTSNQLVCIWKRLADCLMLVRKLPTDLLLTIPSPLLNADNTNNTDREFTKNTTIQQVLSIASRCYIQALQISESDNSDSSNLWLDLAVSYLYRFYIEHNEDLVINSIKYAHHSLKLLASNPSAHKLLSVLYQLKTTSRDVMLAQHHAIVNIQLNNKVDAAAWTNLGVLYLEQNELGLAHQAFSNAQSANPLYVPAWLGQARVAESLKPEDAMDLYRHTAELDSFHLESCKGYSRWVIKTIADNSKLESSQYYYSIHKLNAVVTACHQLDRLNRVDKSSASLNAHSLLLEREGLNRTARDQLIRALEGCTNEERGSIITNLSRVYLSCGDAESSLNLLQTNSSTLTNDDLLTQALSLYKFGKYEESFTVYQDVVEKIADSDKSEVYSALGMIACKLKDFNTAKSAFTQSSQFNRVSSHGITALCSISLLTNDVETALVARIKLDKMKDNDVKLSLNSARLNAALYKLTNDWKRARNCLLAHVHSYPWCSGAINDLLSLCLTHMSELRTPVLRLASALSTDKELMSLMYLTAGKTGEAKQFAEYAVHQQPADMKTRLPLVAILSNSDIDIKRILPNPELLTVSEKSWFNSINTQ